MIPCPRNWVAIDRAVMYFDWAAHAFSAGFKCTLYTYTCSWFQIQVSSKVRSVFFSLIPNH